MLRALYGHPAIEAARRYTSAFLSGLGRMATLVAAGAAGTALFVDGPLIPGSMLAATVAAGLGGTFLSPRMLTAHPKKRPIATTIYLAPHGFLSAILTSELITDSTEATLYEGGALLVWLVGVWWLRPASLGKRVAKWPEPELGLDDQADDDETGSEVEVSDPVPDDPAAAWWHLNAAKDKGVAPGTAIIEMRKVEDGRRLAVAIGAKVPGEAVPKIDLWRLSALFNLPTDLLEMQSIPNFGTGVAMLLIGPKPEAPVEADADVWAEIGRSALPGVVLIEMNEYDLDEESKELTT